MAQYDRQGNPISLDTYIELLSSSETDYRRVALTGVGDYTVSTIWLGIDMMGWGGGPPIIFETMVFANGSPRDLDCQRYSTEAEALEGHEAVVTLLRATT